MSLHYKETGLVELIEALDALDAAEERLQTVTKAHKDAVKAARARARAVRDAAAGRDQQVELPMDARASAALDEAKRIAATARREGIAPCP